MQYTLYDKHIDRMCIHDTCEYRIFWMLFCIYATKTSKLSGSATPTCCSTFISNSCVSFPEPQASFNSCFITVCSIPICETPPPLGGGCLKVQGGGYPGGSGGLVITRCNSTDAEQQFTYNASTMHLQYGRHCVDVHSGGFQYTPTSPLPQLYVTSVHLLNTAIPNQSMVVPYNSTQCAHFEH